MDNKEYFKRAQKMFHQMVAENGFFQVPTKEDIKNFKRNKIKVLGLPIDRALIEAKDVSQTVEFIQNLETTKDYFINNVMLTISGYDEDERELYEIPEVVNWTRKLLFEAPQAFYYVNEESSWNFIKASIAKEITVLNVKGDKMDMYEVSRRIQLGLPVTQYQLMLIVESHVLSKILTEIKLLGSRINDINGAMLVAHKLEHSFSKE